MSEITLTLSHLAIEEPSTWWRGKLRKRMEAHGLLYGVLLVQAVLTLLLSNTAFNDEATYIMVGHAEIAHLLHSTVIPNYSATISGAPFIYPPFAAILSAVGGLTLVRLVSLAFMLLSTCLVFGSTRRLFGWGSASFAAATFAVSAPTLFMGNLATFDAMTVFLLALALWVGITGTDKFGPKVWLLEILAGVFAGFAGVTKYAGLLFLPSIFLVIFLADQKHRRFWRSLLRTVVPFLIGTGGFLIPIWFYEHSIVSGLRATSLEVTHTPSTLSTIASDTSLYIGAMLILGVVGLLVLFSRKAPLSQLLLGVVLTLTGFLAPIWQLHLHTYVSIQKHTGYGLLFIAPLVGVSLMKAVEHWGRRSVVPLIVLGVALISLGNNVSQSLFSAWPNTTNLNALLQGRVHYGKSLYLVEEGVVPEFYFASETYHRQWVSTYFYSYKRKDKPAITGATAFEEGVEHSKFAIIALSNGPTKYLDVKLERILKNSHNYLLIATLHFDTSFGYGVWRVWQRI